MRCLKLDIEVFFCLGFLTVCLQHHDVATGRRGERRCCLSRCPAREGASVQSHLSADALRWGLRRQHRKAGVQGAAQ